MSNVTQDMVCKIIGTEELLHKSEEIFQGREKSIVFIEDGFQIHSKGLPYYFQLSCFQEIGWNVFLTSISGKIEDDVETDKLYHQLEDAIDIVNAEYYMNNEEERAQLLTF